MVIKLFVSSISYCAVCQVFTALGWTVVDFALWQGDPCMHTTQSWLDHCIHSYTFSCVVLDRTPGHTRSMTNVCRRYCDVVMIVNVKGTTAYPLGPNISKGDITDRYRFVIALLRLLTVPRRQMMESWRLCDHHREPLMFFLTHSIVWSHLVVVRTVSGVPQQ